MTRVPVLWLHDPTALEHFQGKSEYAWQAMMRVSRSGTRVGYIDLPHYDFLAPADEATRQQLRARSIAAMWPQFAAAGAQCLVVFSSKEGPDEAAAMVAGIPGAELTYLVEPTDPGPWPSKTEHTPSQVS